VTISPLLCHSNISEWLDPKKGLEFPCSETGHLKWAWKVPDQPSVLWLRQTCFPSPPPYLPSTSSPENSCPTHGLVLVSLAAATCDPSVHLWLCGSVPVSAQTLDCWRAGEASRCLVSFCCVNQRNQKGGPQDYWRIKISLWILFSIFPSIEAVALEHLNMHCLCL
jgi:hypothetical protein